MTFSNDRSFRISGMLHSREMSSNQLGGMDCAGYDINRIWLSFATPIIVPRSYRSSCFSGPPSDQLLRKTDGTRLLGRQSSTSGPPKTGPIRPFRDVAWKEV